MKSFSKILSLTLSILLLNPISFVYADDKIEINNYSISSMNGCVYEDDIDFNINLKESAVMRDVDFNFLDNFCLSGALEYDGETYPISLKGDVYHFDGGVNKNNLVLGDFITDNKRFEVVNFRIYRNTDEAYLLEDNKNLKNKSTISLAMKDLQSGEVIFLQSQIDKIIFDELLLISIENLNKLDLDEKSKKIKLTSLYVYKKAKSDSKSSEGNGAATSESSDSFENSKGPSSVSYSELKTIIGDINDLETVTLSNYNIFPNFFANTFSKLLFLLLSF